MHSYPMPVNQRSIEGFTLVELAIVLIILSLLTGGLMMSLSAQVQQRQRSETQQQLADIRDALLGYAASHSAADSKPYFPCPDMDGDGKEDRKLDKTCQSAYGQLPWSDLGLGNQDAWGNRFDYRVDDKFSRSDNGFTLNSGVSSPAIKVCEQPACTVTLGSSLPLVVFSHGPNGLGAVTSQNANLPVATGADEVENNNADPTFVSHPPTPSGANEFDDLVIWLSPNILYNRMIAAGRLP
jgi:prepilin-type N-terminal cleavage/methylation domain-containing protein